MICCSDIAGQVRGKGFPARLLHERRHRGVGWTPTNIMITGHGPIAPSPWGPFGDLVLVPDLDAHVRVDFQDDTAPEHFVLGDIRHLDGRPWECCLRDFVRRGLDALRHETGLTVKAAFEHEFHFDGVEERPNSAYGLDAYRRQGTFAQTFMYALERAGLGPDTFMPEYGPCQYEVTIEPAIGLRAADEAVILREMARAAAARAGARASFTPILRPDAVGNGVHVHFSLLAADSRQPVNHDPDRAHGLSVTAGSFLAGILEHLPSLAALTAASTISYLRLVPHRWSAAYNNLGVRDREAAVRICPVFETAGVDVARQYHFEFRAADAAASPYLVLGALIWAGLDGLRRGLPTPTPSEGDPSTWSQAELDARGLMRLPQSLGAALDNLAASEAFKDWMGPTLHDVYLRHKRFEDENLSALPTEEQCARYRLVY
ncbi:MAG: glutamine synthetase [Alphaproteobacteria bacterium]|nr:MAG: glutamine synthetase [Alphaproteobacteria bacterium]